MRKDKLTKVRDYMRDEMHPQLFDICFITAGIPFELADMDGLKRNDPHCSSTCCVVGTLPILFPEEHQYTPTGLVESATGVPYFGFVEEFERCMEVSWEQANWITGPGGYEGRPTITDVVARLDALLALEDGDGSVPDLES
jgi:hypothetical protein